MERPYEAAMRERTLDPKRSREQAQPHENGERFPAQMESDVCLRVYPN
jgi:hypothetical protein